MGFEISFWSVLSVYPLEFLPTLFLLTAGSVWKKGKALTLLNNRLKKKKCVSDTILFTNAEHSTINSAMKKGNSIVARPGIAA